MSLIWQWDWYKSLRCCTLNWFTCVLCYMEFKLNNDLQRHNEAKQINRNHWLEIFRGAFGRNFYFRGAYAPLIFFCIFHWPKQAPLKKKRRPPEDRKAPPWRKKAPPWKVYPLINLPLLLKNVTGTQGASGFPKRNMRWFCFWTSCDILVFILLADSCKINA